MHVTVCGQKSLWSLVGGFSNPVSGLHGWGLSIASIQDAGCSVSALPSVNCCPSACCACPTVGLFCWRDRPCRANSLIPDPSHKQSRIPPGWAVTPGNLTMCTLCYMMFRASTAHVITYIFMYVLLTMLHHSFQPIDFIKFINKSRFCNYIGSFSFDFFTNIFTR